jgi:hypothetical protein
MKYVISILLLSITILAPFSIDEADAFADKMQPYFGIPTNWQFKDLGSWWSATLAVGDPLVCTTTVYLSPRWKTEKTALWKYTLAHEWAHVLQGSKCVNNERNANIIALTKLAEAKEWGAFLMGVNWLLGNKFNDRVVFAEQRISMEDVKGVLQDVR